MRRRSLLLAVGAAVALSTAAGAAEPLCQRLDGPARIEFAGHAYELAKARRCGEVESRRFRPADAAVGDVELVWRRYLGKPNAAAFLRRYLASLSRIANGKPQVYTAAAPGADVAEYVVEARVFGVAASKPRFLLHRVVVGDGERPMQSFVFTYHYPGDAASGEARVERSGDDWRRAILELAPEGVD